ncbi:EAL domain-containing protein [Agrobacterium pusense]|uniref:EAL domain-containing protein n=1 Tax=Agrobacterium pusense TaxID=648995 RepID=UPI0028AC4EED|nr:EAL domain-containing protein [Agrobacterium pusense]
MMAFRSDGGMHSSSRGDAGRRGSLRLGMAVESITDLSTLEGGVPYNECLARLLIDDEVVLNGGYFIAQLEADGGVGLLDTTMVSLVLDALEQNPSLRLGCNISPFTLADQSAWEGIVFQLGQRPSAAKRLTLEVTETAPLSQVAHAAHRLRLVQACGCRIALDDFGSGFAVHRQVRGLDLDWDIVKIDRRFLSDLRKTPSGRDGLASMIVLARAIAPIVIVEGIETTAHLERARDSGASFGQGWLFDASEPGHWRELPALVSERFAHALRHQANPDPAIPAHSPFYTRVGSTPSAPRSAKQTLWQRLRLLAALNRKPVNQHEVT